MPLKLQTVSKLCLLNYLEFHVHSKLELHPFSSKANILIQSLGYIIQMLETLKSYSCICFKI